MMLMREVEYLFVLSHLRDGTVLDVGCGNGVLSQFLSLAMGREVTGVDYYNPEFYKGFQNFYRGDFVEMDMNGKKFDNIVCVSTIEHSGCETAELDMGYFSAGRDREMAAKIVECLNDDGSTIIVTVPFGEDTMHFVDGSGNHTVREKAKWGYREYRVPTLLSLFEDVRPKEYFDFMNCCVVSCRPEYDTCFFPFVGGPPMWSFQENFAMILLALTHMGGRMEVKVG